MHRSEADKVRPRLFAGVSEEAMLTNTPIACQCIPCLPDPIPYTRRLLAVPDTSPEPLTWPRALYRRRLVEGDS